MRINYAKSEDFVRVNTNEMSENERNCSYLYEQFNKK